MTPRSAAGGVAAIAAVSALMAWLSPATFRSLPLHAPDTVSYLAWDPFRPVLYPLFLSLARQIDSTLSLVGPIQLTVLIVSVSLLAITIARRLQSPLTAVAFAAVVLWHPQVISYTFTALPESFLMASAALLVHTAIQLQANPTPRAASQQGLLLAAGVLAKPVAMSWLAALPILAMTMEREARRRVLGVVLAAFLLPTLAASAINYLRIGAFAPQLGAGFATLGVTASLIDADSSLEPARLRDALVSDLAPIRRELNALPSLEWYYFFSSHAYHITLERARDIIYEQSAVTEATPALLRSAILNAAGRRVAAAALVENFGGYARHVAAHLYGLWLTPLVKDAADQRFVEELQHVAEVAPTLATPPLMYRPVPTFAYWPYKAGLLGALVLSCLSFVAVRWKMPAWSAVAYAAAALHGYFLLTAAAQTGLPRYALAAWPLSAFVLCVGSLALTRAWDQHRRTLRSSPDTNTRG